MITSRILHTPAVTGYLGGDKDLRLLLSAAAREMVTLVLPSTVLAMATSNHPELYLQRLSDRVSALLTNPAIVVDHLVDRRGEGERAVRAGFLVDALDLTLEDAQTADLALNRSAPVLTTRAGAARLAKIEPRPAFDLIG
ncbi:hypothetical protein [Nonomuraea roseoviolacea]|uniref:PIN domain-containing protein n=1 Tax=Nonomuraea roseoviolacea subsp. carminata TaxID=160689 RepID=A0ABT1JTM9_9ACTN|nr:hypothetical protein [Nonomuraea roseoviolacea]MCP2345101.1 hypothetical protein [Nonomuraea roseoviolacea subsp. carminata]